MRAQRLPSDQQSWRGSTDAEVQSGKEQAAGVLTHVTWSLTPEVTCCSRVRNKAVQTCSRPCCSWQPTATKHVHLQGAVPALSLLRQHRTQRDWEFMAAVSRRPETGFGRGTTG